MPAQPGSPVEPGAGDPTDVAVEADVADESIEADPTDVADDGAPVPAADWEPGQPEPEAGDLGWAGPEPEAGDLGWAGPEPDEQLAADGPPIPSAPVQESTEMDPAQRLAAMWGHASRPDAGAHQPEAEAAPQSADEDLPVDHAADEFPTPETEFADDGDGEGDAAYSPVLPLDGAPGDGPHNAAHIAPQSPPATTPGGAPNPAADTGPLTAEELSWASGTVEVVVHALEQRVVGQLLLEETLMLALMTGGHVLLESVPGLAKTTAAATLARAVSGSFARIQCTPDLLPSDIVGTQIYDASTASFETRLGPVHANLVLLDEINRSSAKTQSAMLEAMQERQTSIAGRVHPLPQPFLVLATQNPIEQEGTYVLPEAQLDRFMLKDVLDYPSLDDEAEVIRRIDAGVYLTEPEAVVSLADVLRLQAIVRRVYLDEAVIRYAVGLAYVTRHAASYLEPRIARYVQFGASPRASIAFAQAARARAIIAGRDHVIPDDIKALAHRVLRHRIIVGFEAIADEVPVETIIDAVVAAVRTP